MASHWRGAAPARRGAGPSAAVAELTPAAAEPETKPELVAPSRWLKPISSYARHELARDEEATSYG